MSAPITDAKRTQPPLSLRAAKKSRVSLPLERRHPFDRTVKRMRDEGASREEIDSYVRAAEWNNRLGPNGRYWELLNNFGIAAHVAKGSAPTKSFASPRPASVPTSPSNSPVTLGRIQGPNGWKGPEITINRHQQLTNGRYTLDASGMKPHTTGTLAGGRSQFLYHVNEKQLVLDAAAYADDAGAWVGNKAKITFDRPIGVHAGTGQQTTVLNIYRSNTGFVHGAPGSPE